MRSPLNSKEINYQEMFFLKGVELVCFLHMIWVTYLAKYKITAVGKKNILKYKTGLLNEPTKHNTVKCIEILLNSGKIDINAPDQHGNTLLTTFGIFFILSSYLLYRGIALIQLLTPSRS